MTNTGTPAALPRCVPKWQPPGYRQKEVFVPLSHPPGEAQYDFGEAVVVIAGEQVKAALSVMTLPYSDVFHVSAYPRECTETFQAGHLAAFEFFGGVPTRTSYDNSRIAVKRVVGRERELTREFLRLESHFLFAHHFCQVARGNEKGHVEKPGRLRSAQLPRAGPVVWFLRRAERSLGSRLPGGHAALGARQARRQGPAPRSGPRRHARHPR